MHSNGTSEGFDNVSDTELAGLCREGSETAFRQLAGRYFLTLRKKAADASVNPSDIDDLVQEGMIALHYAALTYDENGGASFSTYANVCIRNRIISAVRRENSLKNRLNSSASSIEEAQAVPAMPECDPLNAVIIKEELHSLEEFLRDELSQAESAVLGAYLEGRSYDEISRRLGITKKACDNAMQRVRKKLRQRY